MSTDRREPEEAPEKEEFGELLKFTATGFLGGLLAGILLDSLGFQRSAIGQWIVRTLSGEGESIFEGIYALRQRIRRADKSMAEAYGWGKFLGMTVPWWIDWGSRLLGVDVYGVEGFYIPYSYALSDQIGANISGFVFLRRERRVLGKGHYTIFPPSGHAYQSVDHSHRPSGSVYHSPFRI